MSQSNHRVLRRERKEAEPVRHWKTEAEAGHEEGAKHLTVANSALLATATHSL